MADIAINSEIGALQSVILHEPGKEIENVTPHDVERALYSDILNFKLALKEYGQFKNVLQKVTNTYFLKDLLITILDIPEARSFLINKVCRNENVNEFRECFRDWDSTNMATGLIEGIPLVKDNLTKFLSNERYSLQPLHNLFYMRDTSSVINNNVLISRMANRVREREAIILDTIFRFHPDLKINPLNPDEKLYDSDKNLSIEGGDIIVAAEDILILGTGARTSTHGVDFILEKMKSEKKPKHIIVQQIPSEPESFIHLDMVFTLLDKHTCMIYEPVMLNRHDFETVYIHVENGKVKSIREVPSILQIMKTLKHDLEAIKCGGDTDEWTQEREQWHSGANFFAIAPGKIIGYGRNSYTIEELNKYGFEPVDAVDIIAGKTDVNQLKKAVISIHGSELPRGGGGCRCMTLPLNRNEINWD